MCMYMELINTSLHITVGMLQPYQQPTNSASSIAVETATVLENLETDGYAAGLLMIV